LKSIYNPIKIKYLSHIIFHIIINNDSLFLEENNIEDTWY
jgi:hypothetical protein